MQLKIDGKICEPCFELHNLSDIPVDYNTVYNYHDWLNSMHMYTEQTCWLHGEVSLICFILISFQM